uniref:Protein Y11D7A.8 n=1 Tax=Haemonchus contortus TaxID=6289 RepID=W6ND44_HAECO
MCARGRARHFARRKSHSGCFGEDIAKAICWNLSTKDRLEWTSELLEGYHAYLHANSPEDCQVTLDNVRKAYDMFMPVAMVTLLFKVVAMKDKEDIEPIIDRAKGLIQNVYTMTKLLEK